MQGNKKPPLLGRRQSGDRERFLLRIFEFNAYLVRKDVSEHSLYFVCQRRTSDYGFVGCAHFTVYLDLGKHGARIEIELSTLFLWVEASVHRCPCLR